MIRADVSGGLLWDAQNGLTDPRFGKNVQVDEAQVIDFKEGLIGAQDDGLADAKTC